MSTDVTYESLQQKREAYLLTVIKKRYCQFINDMVDPDLVTVEPFEEAAGTMTTFFIRESGKARYAYSMLTYEYKLVMGGKEPKISSKFFKPI